MRPRRSSSDVTSLSCALEPEDLVLGEAWVGKASGPHPLGELVAGERPQACIEIHPCGRARDLEHRGLDEVRLASIDTRLLGAPRLRARELDDAVLGARHRPLGSGGARSRSRFRSRVRSGGGGCDPRALARAAARRAAARRAAARPERLVSTLGDACGCRGTGGHRRSRVGPARRSPGALAPAGSGAPRDDEPRTHQAPRGGQSRHRRHYTARASTADASRPNIAPHRLQAQSLRPCPERGASSGAAHVLRDYALPQPLPPKNPRSVSPAAAVITRGAG